MKTKTNSPSFPLVKIMAKACHYAQEHIDDKDAWSQKIEDREAMLQCVSYQMACFFAQNTILGDEGVDWSIVIKELTGVKKSEKQWENILSKIAKNLGDWKEYLGGWKE